MEKEASKKMWKIGNNFINNFRHNFRDKARQNRSMFLDSDGLKKSTLIH